MINARKFVILKFCKQYKHACTLRVDLPMQLLGLTAKTNTIGAKPSALWDLEYKYCALIGHSEVSINYPVYMCKG